MRILSLLYVFQKILPELFCCLLVDGLLFGVVGLLEQALVVTLLHLFLPEVFCLL